MLTKTETNSDGEEVAVYYSDDDISAQTKCTGCTHKYNLQKCQTHLQNLGFSAHFHPACTTFIHESCLDCRQKQNTPPPPTHITHTPQETPIHACDGSYKARTHSSTAGVVLDFNSPNPIHISEKLTTHPDEPADSYLSELRSLNLQYEHTPPDWPQGNSYKDNLEVISLHTRLMQHTIHPRSLLNKKYRSEIRRLQHNIHSKPPKQLHHIYSHQEHLAGPDHITIPRKALATADHLAELAHTLPPREPITTYREPFPIYYRGHWSDDKPRNIAQRTINLHYLNHLKLRKMEGELERTLVRPHLQLPHLRPTLKRFLTQIFIQRLPTNTELHRRHYLDSPNCSHCTSPTQDTISHALLDCPNISHLKPLIRQIIILITRTHSFHLHPSRLRLDNDSFLTNYPQTQGWNIHITDKHSRSTTLYEGRNAITHKGHTYHPDLFAHWIRLQSPTTTITLSPYSIDPTILNAIAKHLHLSLHHTCVRFNPYLRHTNYTSLPAPPSSSLIANLIHHPAHKIGHLLPLPTTQCQVLFAHPHSTHLLTHLDYTLVHEIPPQHIHILPTPFWTGQTHPQPKNQSNTFPILVWGKNLTHLHHQIIIETCLTRYTQLSPAHNTYLIPSTDLSPLTPPTLWSTWDGPQTPQKLLLFSGTLNSHLINQYHALAIPSYKLNSLYKTFHIQLLSQLHRHWCLHTKNKPSQPPRPPRKPPPALKTHPTSTQPSTWHKHRSQRLTQQDTLKLFFSTKPSHTPNHSTRVRTMEGDGDGEGLADDEDADNNNYQDDED